MRHLRVVSRYIKSLLDLAVEQGALEQVHMDMQLFSRVCDENRAFRLMLHNPIIKHDKKRDILEKLFKGKVHALTMAILDIITRKNREPLLPEIAREFHNAYNVYKGIGKASVTTAISLDAATRKQFEQIVRGILDKKEVELEERVDADMIGGFILNAGDKQIDASVKNKLKALKMELSKNLFVKEY